MAVCTVRSLRFIKTVLELISHAIHSKLALNEMCDIFSKSKNL